MPFWVDKYPMISVSASFCYLFVWLLQSDELPSELKYWKHANREGDSYIASIISVNQSVNQSILIC